MLNHCEKQHGGSSKKLKIEISFDPGIPLPGIYPKNVGALFQKYICTPKFIATLFTIAKIWKPPKCPSVDEWIKLKKIGRASCRERV